MLVTLLVASGLTLVGATPAAAAPPAVDIAVTGGDILAGESGTYTVTATNPGATDGYNLAIYLDVPAGVVFESSSLGDPVVYDASNPPATALPAGVQRWVWEDVSDLPAGGDVSGTVTVRPAQPAMGSGTTADTTVFPVGSEFAIAASAALGSDPTLLPVFNGATGVGGAAAEAATGTAGPATVDVTVIPLILTKSEPSPEAELLRGVHAHTTVYTLTIRATSEGATTPATVVDYLPAGLEFLSCGAEDNSTVDRDTADAAVNEYDGAASLSGTPAVGADCRVPVSVSTITADAALADSYGLDAGAVYTRVEWNLGTLAAGSTTTLRYAAGIPLRENTITWDGAEPTPASGDQAANLDNNTGASTRHGAQTPVDGRVLTNVATVTGDYAGVVRTGSARAVVDSDAVSVHAMDLAVLKSVDPADGEFRVGNVADFTLTLRAGEYASSAGIVLTDVLPNGLCPLLPEGVNMVLDAGASLPAECDATGVVTGAVVDSATAHADGTVTLVLRPTDGGDPADFVAAPSTEHQVTYQALNRAAYETAAEYGATTSGDAFGNTVEVEATTSVIDAILADYPDSLEIWDDSSALLSTALTAISKTVMPRAQVETGLAADVDPCTDGTFSDAVETGFRMGDTVCFELTVDFPESIDTRNAVVTDFLPAGLTLGGYAVAAASTLDAGAVSLDDSGATAGRLTWELGLEGAGGDLYVPRGSLFVAHVWATVDAPSNGLELDKPQNLMKYRQQNVEGDLFFLRDQAQIEVDPELQLVKGVLEVEDNAGGVSSTRGAQSQDALNGADFASNRDGILVREGEVVTYRVDLVGLPYPATASEVWDLLPAGITAADVANLTHGGVVYDPSDPGRPAGLDAAHAARSVIVWTNIDVPAAGETLTYDVTVPTPTGVTETLDNTASIIAYRAGINTSTDPAAQEYIPAGSLDTSREDSANTPGDGTRDDSGVYLPSVSVAKSVTSPTGANNTAAQVVPGEVAEFTFSVTVPAHSSVFGGVLRDVISGASNWSILADETSVDHPGGSTAAGATGFTWGGQDFTIDPATGVLTFPATYTNATDTDQVFTVHLSASIRSGSTWTHSPATARTDTARFTSTGAPTAQATANVRLIEPGPAITKTANDDTVTAGQVVRFTVVASNATGRPTLEDAVVTDCVPDAFASVSLVSLTTGMAVAGGDPSCEGTLVTWTVGSIAAGATATLAYDATVAPSAAGGASYTNTAELVGYSLPAGPDVDRREYTVTSPEVVTVEGAAFTKTVDAPTATIGQEREFTLSTTVPANVNFYDAAIIDDVPAGMAVSDVTVSCTDSDDAPCDADLPGAGAALTPAGTLQGWWLGDILSAPVTRTITVTYTGTVLDLAAVDAGDAIVNTARMRWNTANTLTDAPTASYTGTQSTVVGEATVTVVEPQLDIAKAVNGAATAAVDPGETFTFGVTIDNLDGTSTAYGVTVSDDIPVGVVVDPASVSGGGVLTGAGVNGGGTLTWTLPSLVVDGQVTFTYEASLAASSTLDGTALTNTAQVDGYFSHPTGTGFDDDERRAYTGPQDTAAVTPQFPAPVITKAATGTTAYVGEEHTFTLTLTNPGDSVATSVEVADALPEGFVYVAGSSVVTPGTDVEPAVAGQDLTWTGLPDLAPGDTVTITYRAVADEDHDWTATTTGSGVDHVNQAIVTAEDSSGAPGNADGDYTDDADEAVQLHRAELSLAKTHGSQPVAGRSTTWTLEVSNAEGVDPAVGPIVITDQLPEDAVFVSADGTGWTASLDAATNELTLTHPGPLAAGASLEVDVTAVFGRGVEEGTDATNSACVSARTFESDTSDNCATDPDTVATLADLEIDKIATASTYVAGESITWHMAVSNNGPSVSRSPITVTDQLPESVDWDSVSVIAPDWDVEIDADTGLVTATWNGTDLGYGNELPILVMSATVVSGWTGTVTNTATVAGTTDEPATPGTTNNSDTATTGAVGTRADLGIDKSIASDALVAGGEGRYRIEVANDGPSDALAVIVTDQLPEGVTFAGGLTSAAGDTWECVESGAVDGQLDCALTSGAGTLVAGDDTWFEFDVEIASSVVGEITNVATVGSDTEDDNPDNDSDSVSEDALVTTNLSLAKTHDEDTVYRAGDEVRFTLTVRNDGDADAVDVVVTDTLPAEMTLVSVDGGEDWTTDGPDGDGVLRLSLDGPLPAGATASVDVIVTVSADAVPTVTNAAQVETSTTETDDSDNSATDEVEVDTPDLVVSKSASLVTVEGGDTLTYTIGVSNMDDDARADQVVVVDQIPAELAVISDLESVGGADWTCTLIGADEDGYGGTLECTLDTLAPLTLATPIVVDTTVATGVARDTLTNTVTVASDDEHPDAVDELNSSEATVDVRWIDIAVASICVADARWLEYTVDARNVDAGLPVTFTWYPDADGDLVADGPAVATQTLDAATSATPLSDRILWPGAAVDEDGVGIAWPGWRQVTAGETPEWEDQIPDPALPEYALLAGAMVEVTVNPSATVGAVYPAATPDCEVVRDAQLTVDKTASTDSAVEGDTVSYALAVANTGYGATDTVTLRDRVPADLRVTGVETADAGPGTAAAASWDECTVTGRDADGFGGTVECTMTGWLGHGDRMPVVTVEAVLRDGIGDTTVTNVGTVEWADPEGPGGTSGSETDDAVVEVSARPQGPLSSTGAQVGGLVALSALLLGLGGLLIAARRRREA